LLYLPLISEGLYYCSQYSFVWTR